MIQSHIEHGKDDAHKIQALAVFPEQFLDGGEILHFIGGPFGGRRHKGTGDQRPVQHLGGTDKGGQELIEVPSVPEIVVAQRFHLRLRLQHNRHVGQAIISFSLGDHRIKNVFFKLLCRQRLDYLPDILRQPVARPAQGMVALLLLVTLEFLIRIPYQADVDKLRPVGVSGSFAAHIDHTVSKRAPAFAHHGDAAALESFKLPIAGGRYFIGDTGK